MKLIVQIPCYNEEVSIADVISQIPTEIDGIDNIEILIIDDGSSDDTVKIAKDLGVKYIINNIGNKGLGISFSKGMEYALAEHADILVNTDGDNQYPGEYIPDLVKPILNKEADIVIGNRQTSKVSHFSLFKKFFQWLGTRVVIFLSGEQEIKDAVSGFRAYNRSALLELNVTDRFSYTLDTIIQASEKRLKTKSIPIHINNPTRESRLFKNNFQHIRKSGTTALRTFALYKPLKVFIGIGIIFFIIGIIPIIRFLIDYFLQNEGSGKIQSLIIGSILLSMSFNFFALGIIGDLLGRNRKLIEDILKKVKE